MTRERAIVVGAGVMGAWTALWLRRRGLDVLLVDLYGPGNSLSSSGDESRLIRHFHGPDAFYPRWVARAWEHWRALERESGLPLLHEIGALWLAHRDDGFEASSLETAARLEIACERLERTEIGRRWPVLGLDDVTFAAFELRAGALMARRAVATAAERLAGEGGAVTVARATLPAADAGGPPSVTVDGRLEAADVVVFACGPWLPRLFPELLAATISVTRQEVLYVATPPGDPRYRAGDLPVWVDYDRAFYGIPSIESRGMKVAPDWPGPQVDPDRQERRVTDASVAASRAFLAERFPALAEAPVSEGRVCQYESTADSHFVIDRHPSRDGVWILGGGSGHGFKHGPVIGEYAAALICDDGSVARELGPPDDRFALRPRQPSIGLRTSAQEPGEAGSYQSSPRGGVPR